MTRTVTADEILTEAVFQGLVLDMAETFGWEVFHDGDSRRSNVSAMSKTRPWNTASVNISSAVTVLVNVYSPTPSSRPVLFPTPPTMPGGA